MVGTYPLYVTYEYKRCLMDYAVREINDDRFWRCYIERLRNTYLSADATRTGTRFINILK